MVKIFFNWYGCECLKKKKVLKKQNLSKKKKKIRSEAGFYCRKIQD